MTEPAPKRWPCCPHCTRGHVNGHPEQCRECERPDLCWSRHLDNIGKPRPEATWTLTYGCENEHTITTNLCDRCASSLVDGRQHCVVCVSPMVVTSLVPMEAVDA